MDFSVMQTECFMQLGLDASDSTNISNVKRWLNMAQQDIAGRWPWNFLRGREAITTIADITTGTVSVSALGTAVTGVGTSFAAADIGKFIQFAGANDWYEVTARSSTTAITIGTAYQGTTNLSGGTYLLRKFFYSLSSSADRIIDIKNWNTPLKLIDIDPRTLDDLRPNPQSAGTSSAFIAYGYDSSGNLRISPFPFPSDARLLEIRTIVRLADLTGTQTSALPAKWHHIMIMGALALGFAYLRKFDASRFWNDGYEGKIAVMMKQERTSEDDQPILKAIDSVSRGNFIRFPDQYPAIGPGGA